MKSIAVHFTDPSGMATINFTEAQKYLNVVAGTSMANCVDRGGGFYFPSLDAVRIPKVQSSAPAAQSTASVKQPSNSLGAAGGISISGVNAGGASYASSFANDESYQPSKGWDVKNSGGSSNPNGKKPTNKPDKGEERPEYSNPINPKKVDAKLLEKNGIDPHKLKYDTLGKRAEISKYNTFVDRDGSVWLQRNGTKGFIPTYVNINK